MKRYLYTIVNELTKEVKHTKSLRNFCNDLNETIGLPCFITIDQANNYWNRKNRKKPHVLDKLPSHIIFYRGVSNKTEGILSNLFFDEDKLKEINKNIPLL